MQERKAKASSNLLQTARNTLRKLLPAKDDVLSMHTAARQWLMLIHTMLAQPFGLNTSEELIKVYNDMLKPDVDTMTLAAWLLELALTVDQGPSLQGSPATSTNRAHRASNFARAVSDAVETTPFSHDRLLGTIRGL